MLKYPVNYIAVTQYFLANKHNGMDLGWSSSFGGENQQVYAADDGVVSSVRSDYETNDTTGSSYGNYVKIRHSDSISTLCAHLKQNSVTLKVGDKVKKGDKIGLMGNTGYAFGNHLHYEVFLNDKKVDPIIYTYVYPNQIVSSNPDARKDLLYYKEEEEDTSTLKKMIQELEDKIKLLEKENNELALEIKEMDEELKKSSSTISSLNVQIKDLNEKLKNATNYIFSYDVLKTSYYKIKLYEGEVLYIKK